MPSSAARPSGGELFAFVRPSQNGDDAPAVTQNFPGLIIFGDNGANLLIGTAGDDIIYGFGGNDRLVGLGGNDILDGGAGADRLEGGYGFDYAGYETAFAGVTASLADPVHNTGDAAGDSYTSIEGLIGSDYADTLTGNDGVNALYGGAGNDILNGRGGSDHLFGGPGNDRLNGGGGNDWLYGEGGNDRLDGGAGNDRLYGGGGLDSFVFDTPLSATSNIDQIFDFRSIDDTILLSGSIFTTIGPPGPLPAGEFFVGAHAADADDRIIYNKSTGALSYDPDGTGPAAATQFAALSPGLAIGSGNFHIF
jgi:Ca2+-binding RTX toxin-like protein